MNDFDKMVDFLKGGVVRIGAAFTKPDDDWVPCASLLTPKGVEILPLSFANDDEKEDAATAIGGMTIVLGATVVGFVMSAWTLEVPQDKYDEWQKSGERPSESADKKEVVVISVVDAKRSKTLLAPIIRYEKAPPTLGEWNEGGTAMGGRFIDPVQQALVLAANALTPTKQN